MKAKKASRAQTFSNYPNPGIQFSQPPADAFTTSRGTQLWRTSGTAGLSTIYTLYCGPESRMDEGLVQLKHRAPQGATWSLFLLVTATSQKDTAAQNRGKAPKAAPHLRTPGAQAAER